MAFAVVGGCPGVETCVADFEGSAAHLVGTADGGGEGVILATDIASTGAGGFLGLLFFSLKAEGEEEGLIHLLLAYKGAAMLTLVACLELGWNGALDGVGGYILGAVPAAGLA